MQIKDDFVAQLVEQLTLNQWAVGSSPTEVTGKPLLIGRFSSFICLFSLYLSPLLSIFNA